MLDINYSYINVRKMNNFIDFVIYMLFSRIISVSSGKPNILLIIADDLGIGDIGCYGNDSIRTPHIDRLAEDGIKLTHHFTAAAVCTPSRAALMVSRYPVRYGFYKKETGSIVLVHVGTTGHLPHSEITLAEVLTAANYSTGFVGKWHLGPECELFGLRCPGPLNHGFSFSYDLPFTLVEEMKKVGHFFTMESPFVFDAFYQGISASIIVVLILTPFLMKKRLYTCSIVLILLLIFTIFSVWLVHTHLRLHKVNWWWFSDWMVQNMDEVTVRNGIPERQTLNFDTLAKTFINESVLFIERKSNKETPFFLIHSFLHVHTPMFCEKRNAGRSCCGRYGDNVEEMDDGVGSLINALEVNNILENTIIYFLSDHGGHLEAIADTDGQRIGGYNKHFKGGKGMGGQEGGIRVPGIISWNKTLPTNKTMDKPTSAMDIMPTLLEIAGLPTVHELVPNENELDGRSFAEFLLDGNKVPSEDRVFLHYCQSHIHAARLRTGNKVYKMHLKQPKWLENSTQCGWGAAVFCDCDKSIDLSENPLLFELTSDTYEDSPISSNTTEYLKVVQYLRNFIQEWKQNVTYAEPIFSQKSKNTWKPWRQPFCIWNW